MNPLACTDPQRGDVVAVGTKVRTVVKRDGGDVFYQTESGKLRSCWISTWQEWCRKADYTMTAGSKSK